MQYAICNMQYCNSMYITHIYKDKYIQYVIYNMQYAICNIQYAICNIKKIIYVLYIMKIYKTYENANLYECMNAYINGNESQKYYCDKYNICIRTFMNYWKIQKNNIIGGGKIDKNKLPQSKEQKQVFKEQKQVFKEQKQKQEDGLKFMKNMKGGRNNKNAGNFIDEMKNSESVFVKKENHKKTENYENKSIFRIPPSKPHKPVDV
jgi:hypothetical protein